MRRALGFAAGFVLGWAAAMAVYVAGDSAGVWRDRDGGVAMGFAFTLGPLLGVIVGSLLALKLGRRTLDKA